MRDEDEDEHDRDMALNTYKSPGYCHSVPPGRAGRHFATASS
jgi:hypothetical protein